MNYKFYPKKLHMKRPKKSMLRMSTSEHNLTSVEIVLWMSISAMHFLITIVFQFF